MKSDRSEFERIASEDRRPLSSSNSGVFLRHNKKWWLLPILLMLVVMGALLFLAATPLAPFIYPLF